MVTIGDKIEILTDLIQDHILLQRAIHADETTVQVLKEPGKKAESKSYIWTLSTIQTHLQPAVFYQYSTNRNKNSAAHILKNFSGFLHIDGYAGYNAVIETQNITRVGCMAHARRKFVEAASLGSHKGKSNAQEFLDLIKKLYAIEAQIKDQIISEKTYYRQLHGTKILDEILAKALALQPVILADSKLGTAIQYLLNHWSSLTTYTTHNDLAIDNNHMENLIRPFALGRKNWLFADTQAGADASARLYTLIQSAKLNNLVVEEYLIHVFTELPKILQNPDQNDLKALLPWNFQPHTKT